MQKGYTTIKESKFLLDLGISGDTADMCYTINDETKSYNTIPTCIPYSQFTAKKYYMPCWSALRLMELLDKTDDVYVDEEWPTTIQVKNKLGVDYIVFLIGTIKKDIKDNKIDITKLNENVGD